MLLKSVLPFLTGKYEKSEIEFYLIDAFEIYHYLPVYRELISRGIKARIVAEPCRTNTATIWFDWDTATSILKGLKIDYREKADKNCLLAITTQSAETLCKYKNLKINMAYGVSLKQNNFLIAEESCIGFDARLVHGEYQKRAVRNLMKQEDVFIMGYPKHDAFFKNMPSKTEIKKSLGITTPKPILLYTPTWDDDSSILMFGDEIGKLKSNFYIATKPHHCTFRLPHKRNELKKLYQISDYVFDGNASLESLAILADIAVADAKSGSATELKFLNHNLPLVMLSPKRNLDAYFLPEIYHFGPVANSVDGLKRILHGDIKACSVDVDMEGFYGKADGLNASRTAEILIDMIRK